MRGNITNMDQERDYAAYNDHFGDVYNMMNDAQEEEGLQPIEEAEEEQMSSSMFSVGAAAGKSAAPRMAAREEAKKEKKKEEKGIFAKFSDKMSAGLFKASKMNKN